MKSKRPSKNHFYRKTWRVIHCILSPNLNTLKANLTALNKFFNETDERRVRNNPASDVIFFIGSLKNKCFKITNRNVQWRVKNLKSLLYRPFTRYGIFVTVSEHTASLLTHIINNLIKQSKFPDQWKIARIIPIPKVSNPTELKAYRTILNFPTLSETHKKIALLTN